MGKKVLRLRLKKLRHDFLDMDQDSWHSCSRSEHVLGKILVKKSQKMSKSWCSLRPPSRSSRPRWSWGSCLPLMIVWNLLSFQQSQIWLTFKYLSKANSGDDILAYILPNEIQRQMNKYLKPKNFIETLQFF